MRPTRDFAQKLQHLVGNAVGTRPNRQRHDLRVSHCLGIDLPKAFNRGICVRGRLEVRYEVFTIVPPSDPARPLVDLVSDVHSRGSAAGAEASIIAEHTAARSYSAVDIRTRESTIDAYPVNTMAEPGAQKKAISIESQARAAPIIVRRISVWR